jgi:ABC-type polysaccharide/polyol phosphate export permease
LSSNGWLIELHKSFGLWRIWMRLGVQDIRLRFRRSLIGPGWILLNLILVLGAIGLIYTNLLSQDVRQFLPYLTIGLITWGYLVSAIVDGGNAFLASEGYIKQISLPLYVYVFRLFVSASLTAGISLLVYPIVALIYQIPIGIGILWAIPGLVVLCSVALLLTFIFAHINTRFRDASPLASAGMQVLFYVTPVIFPSDLLRGRHLGFIVDFNPLFHLLELVRAPLLHSQPAEPINYVVGVGVIGVLVLCSAGLASYYQRGIIFYL